MKRILLVCSVLAAGVAAGLAAAELRFRLLPCETAILRPGGNPGPGSPRAVVPQTEYDFGRMDLEQKGRHEFLVHNQGDGALRLEVGPTTCSCTVSSLERDEIPPGETTSIAMQWKSKGESGRFQQTATILTNDPQQPRIELTVTGIMSSQLDVQPREVVFPQLSATHTATQTVRVYSFSQKPLKVLRHSFSNPESEAFFDLAVSDLPPDELKPIPGAAAGVEVRITVKSGLPQGPLRQTITLETNAPQRPTVEIPVEGRVVSDIALFGPGWDADSNVLRLGSVPRGEGVRKNLILLARGPHAASVRFEVMECQPSALRAEIGPPQRLNESSTSQTTLSVHILENSPPGNFTGTPENPYGRIRIRTGHPLIPELTVFVSFDIEG